MTDSRLARGSAEIVTQSPSQSRLAKESIEIVTRAPSQSRLIKTSVEVIGSSAVSGTFDDFAAWSVGTDPLA